MRDSNGSPSDRPGARPSWDAAPDPLLPGMPLDQIGQALASAYDDLIAEGVPEHLAGLVRRVRQPGPAPSTKGADAGAGHGARAPTVAAEAADGATDRGRRLALVVEDEPETRALAESLLEETELDVVGCDSAERALSVLQERGGEVALIFADIRLAGAMDGAQLASAAATLWPTARLVLTSGVTPERPDAVPDQAVFIPKPWRARDLLAQAAHAAGDPPPAVA